MLQIADREHYSSLNLGYSHNYATIGQSIEHVLRGKHWEKSCEPIKTTLSENRRPSLTSIGRFSKLKNMNNIEAIH